jgi:RNA polymerase sigma-70 factor (ECF subfamily)
VCAIETDTAAPRQEFAYLVDEYGDSVYRFCRSLTYTREDADDLFQETYLRVLGQLQKVNAAGDPRSFLFSAALFIWKSWKRKFARRKRLAPVETLAGSAAGGLSMEEAFMAKEEAQIVRQLVEALPEKFKVPTILYYTVEMCVSDIAVVLKIPAGTVKSRLFKARKLIEKGWESNHHGK